MAFRCILYVATINYICMRDFTTEIGGDSRLAGGPEDPRNFKFPEEGSNASNHVDSDIAQNNAEQVFQEEAAPIKKSEHVMIGMSGDTIKMPKEYEDEFRKITERKEEYNKKVETAWSAINDHEGKKQLKGALLYLVRDKIAGMQDRDTLTLTDVEDFFRKYPTYEEYASKGRDVREKLLNNVSTIDAGVDKRAEYLKSLADFAKIMYPEQGF